MMRLASERFSVKPCPRVLVGAAALLFVFSATRHEINRLEGGIMLVLFVVYYLAVFVP